MQTVMKKALLRSCLLSVGILLFAGSGTTQTIPDVQRDTTLDVESMIIEASKQKFLGNEDKARLLYEEILAKRPDHALSAYELGRIALKKEDFEQALKYAAQAARKEPQNEWYQRFWADVYQAMGRYREAAGILEAVVKSKPGDKALYLQWAHLLEKANLFPASLKVYDEMEVRFGLLEEIIQNKVRVSLAMADPKKAARELERLSAAFPTNLDYLHTLAAFYQNQNDPAKAQQTYQRILSLAPSDSRAMAVVAAASKLQGPDPEGFKTLETLVQNPNAEASFKAEGFRSILARPETSKDPALLEKLLALAGQFEQLHPGAAPAYAISGEILLLNGQGQAAVAKFLRSLELEEVNYPVWALLLNQLAASGDSKALRRYAANAIDLFPNRPALYYWNALGAFWQGDYAPAKSDLEQALLMASGETALRVEILTALGMTLSVQQDSDGADRVFGQAMALDPNSPLLLARQAWSMAERNQNLEQAAEWAKKARQLSPSLPDVPLALGLIAFRNGDFAGARKHLEPLLPIANPMILEQMGDVSFKLGQTTDALSFWNQAREKGSRSQKLSKKISDKQLYE